MRIGLQATNIFFEGPKHAGVSRTSLRLLEAILKHDEHEYVVFVRPESPIPEHWKSMRHVEVVRTWQKTRTWHYIGRDIEPLRYKLKAWFSVSGYVPRTPGVLKGSLVHDVFWRKYPDTYTEEDINIHERMAKNIAQHADFIAANSHATADQFGAAYKLNPNKFLVLPFGIGQDTIPAESLPRPKSLTSDRDYIFTISTLEPRKNLPRLFEAFAMLSEKVAYAGIDLVVAGAKGWKTDGIKERVHKLAIQNRVHFLGFVPDEEVPALFQHARMAVTASLDEGFGVPVLEALTYGSVVAASQVPAIQEIGQDLPFYFDPLDASSIASAIKGGLTCTDRMERIAKGKVRSADFSWEKSAEMVLNRLTTR